MTEAGALSGLPPDTATVTAVEDAALRVTVQLLFPGVTTVRGLQARLEMVIGAGCHPVTVTVLPVPDMVSATPVPKTAAVPLSVSGTEPVLVVLASFTVTVATTPLLMVLAFMPSARQMVDPAEGLQVMVLLAADKAGPTAKLTEVTSDE